MDRIAIKDIPRIEVIQEHAKRYPDLDPTALLSTITLLQTMDEMVEALDIHFQRHGTTKGRFMVMVLLKRYCQNGLSPSELAEKAGVTRATITGLLDSLDKDGFIKREPNREDRRGYAIFLTDAGTAFMENMLPDHFRRIAKLMEHLSENERKSLLKILEKVRAGLPALRDDEIE